MKKNISINISGIIFHIEEDGYESLKKYLDSINKYFSSFEDSSEILADIESRIAEIFLSKLNEEKQIITLEDVSALIATMGSVSDFRAVEDQPPFEEASAKGEQNTGSGTRYTYQPQRNLRRDQKRKILGGVCSGIANYFNVDALWIRLLFALLLFVFGITFFIYIIMWIIVPGSYELDEPVVTKRMYRDPEKKVLGGVAAGVAAYTGVELVAIRVIFIALTLASGLGIFLYIVMWLILPEAKTLTEKIEMQGDPVTLSNIESTIKKNQSGQPGGEESTLTRVLLFPFRLIAMILSGLARILGPLVEAVRVIFGVLIVMFGVSLTFTVVVMAGILFGIITSSALALPWVDGINETRIPVDAFVRAFPVWTGIAAFFAAIIPSIFVILLGISAIAKRIVFNGAAGWTLFVAFFVSIAILAVSIPKIVYSFKEEAGYTVEKVYNMNGKTAALKINETGMDEYDAVKLTLEGYDGKVIKLVQKFEAQGRSRQQAIVNAKMVEYNVQSADTVITFDSNIQFKDDAIFRAQRVHQTLYIPYNTKFTMDEGISRLITQWVDSDKLDGYTWTMTEKGGLTCASCPPEEQEEERMSELRDFDEIEITGKFDVRIVHGGDYRIEVRGSDDAKSRYEIDRRGGTLVIKHNGNRDFDWNLDNLKIEEVGLVITMPDLERIEATGIGEIKLDEFSTNDLDIDLRGPVKLRGDVQATSVNIHLSGKSEAELSGHVSDMNAHIELASKLRAYNLEAQNAFVETSGASSAKVNVVGNLEMEEGIASKIDFRGNPQVSRRN